ncbi:lysozyme inhibitor LprI family protein [Acinetobacter sp. WCHAc060042]|uniref:lysozyme inhibitor LprI family protein n=1 Tax=Acinetobacter sp. WCHAc060042 TaxID=2213016 RepID=UPI000DA6D480|nr:lysozyme inhibitor LprI family protein [Acinetobacter sp. WCHAc060042]
MIKEHLFWGMELKQILGLLLVMGLCGGSAFAMGPSKEYEICMKQTGNVLSEIDTCMSKEYKVQKKRLKKVFKIYLDKTPTNEQGWVKQSHQQWLEQRDQICNNKPIVKNEKTEVQRISCLMQMTQTRADMYEARTGSISK